MGNELTFLDSERFKQLIEDGGEGSIEPNIGIRKHFIPDEIKQEGDSDSRVLRFTITTGSVDRDGDTINPKGWDLKAFRKNPVVLFAHDSRRPPIAKASKLKVEDGTITANAEFMDDEIDTSGFSDMIFRMLKGGFLKATSVGFLPIKFEFADEDDEERNQGFFRGIDFLKQELLEFSIVPVPSNREALLEARSKGINTDLLHGWYEEALDAWADYKDILLIPRKELEGFHKILTKKKVSKKPFKLSKKKQDELAQHQIELMKAQKPGEQGYFMEPKIGGKWDVLKKLRRSGYWAILYNVDKEEALEKVVELNSQEIPVIEDLDDYLESQVEDKDLNLESLEDKIDIADKIEEVAEDGNESKSVDDGEEEASTEETSETKTRKLRFIGNLDLPGPSKVQIVDDETGDLIEGIVGFTIDAQVGELTTAHIDLILPGFDIEMTGELVMGREDLQEETDDTNLEKSEDKDSNQDIDEEVIEIVVDEVDDTEETTSNDLVDRDTFNEVVKESLAEILQDVVKLELNKIRGVVNDK